jgi:hypothetical protein
MKGHIMKTTVFFTETKTQTILDVEHFSENFQGNYVLPREWIEIKGKESVPYSFAEALFQQCKSLIQEIDRRGRHVPLMEEHKLRILLSCIESKMLENQQVTT